MGKFIGYLIVALLVLYKPLTIGAAWAYSAVKSRVPSGASLKGLFTGILGYSITIPLWKALVLAVAFGLIVGGGGGISLPNLQLPGMPSWLTFNTRATAAVYTFEKDQTSIPNDIADALDKLNRRTPPIVATVDEIDTTDGKGDVPEQYKASRPAAKAAGLPALVTLSNGKVLKAIKEPKVADLEAIR